MFLKHKPVHAIDECHIHGDVGHTYEFVRYVPTKNKIIIRLRCDSCTEVELDEWNYYEVTPQYWLGFLLGNQENDFTGAS